MLDSTVRRAGLLQLDENIQGFLEVLCLHPGQELHHNDEDLFQCQTGGESQCEWPGCSLRGVHAPLYS